VLGYAALAAQAKSPEEAADYIAKISRAGNLLLTLYKRHAGSHQD
jgi:hypothetical protein